MTKRSQSTKAETPKRKQKTLPKSTAPKVRRTTVGEMLEGNEAIPVGLISRGSKSEEAAAAAHEVAALQEVDRILERLDREIPQAHQRMDALLSRLRTTRIAA